MRRFMIFTVLTGLLLLPLAGCSSAQQGQDPAKVKVELRTEPAVVQAGQKAKLTAAITGLTEQTKAAVMFDIAKADFSTLSDSISAKRAEDGQYYVEKTFDQPGSYVVFIHVYQGDLHITKKKELQVS